MNRNKSDGDIGFDRGLDVEAPRLEPQGLSLENPIANFESNTVHTAAGLAARIEAVARGMKLIVVSNREPCIHERTGQGLRIVRPASGMVTALEPIVRAVGGTWVAHGSGSGDRNVVDARDRVVIHANEQQYTLRRVWLTRQEEEGYYYGLSNSALWPLCHIVYQMPEFRKSDWYQYLAVNEKFCQAVLEEAEGGPAIVFIQDYQLGLLSRLLRNRRSDLVLVQFWHIPWPNREAFRVFPWGEQLLDGLLGNDILGFHIQYHCNNFMDTIDRGIEAKVDYEHFRIFRGGRPTSIRPFPISVDSAQIESDSHLPRVDEKILEFSAAIGYAPGNRRLFVGADRIDYTKGILERLKALDVLMQQHPELRGNISFMQLAAPSRTHIDVYRDLNDRIEDLVDDINWRHQTDEWQPIHYLRAQHDYYAVLAAYRMADVLLTTSLHDGMNLVAKEFISTKSDNSGVLVLSQYTGAAREMPDALLVNPFDVEDLAAAMYAACTMSETEISQRMSRLRDQLTNNNVYSWGAKIFDEIRKVLPQ